MIKLGVDEFTLVLQMSSLFKDQFSEEELIYNWASAALVMIDEFNRLSEFETVFGEMIPCSNAPKGYTIAYTYGEHAFYLAIGFNEACMSMGVIVKFSATALDYFTEQSKLQVYQMLQKIQSDIYTCRLSRIDLTADYIDEDVNVTDIYQSLINKQIGVYREYVSKITGQLAYTPIRYDYRGFLRGDEVPTVYIGSVSSNAMLRIYDKKREQMERKGNKLDEALACRNWTRFEVVLRHGYAAQVHAALLGIGSDDEFANLIACTILQKFRICEVDEQGVVISETEYIEKLYNCITAQNYILRSTSTRNFELYKNIVYLLTDSGCVSTLYKIDSVWGEEALDKMLKYLREYVIENEPNSDCKYWLRRNLTDYQSAWKTFDDYFRLVTGNIP